VQIHFSNQLQVEVQLPPGLSDADTAFHLVMDWLDQGCAVAEAVAAAAAIVCGARWATVNQVDTHSQEVQILALFDDGEFADCYTYHFAGTPCDSVLASKHFCRFDDVQKAFPDDEELQTMGVVDYAGKSVRDVTSSLLGHLVVFHNDLMVDVKKLESVINRLVLLLQLEWDNVKIPNA
jgi:hypothetical protein